MNCFIISLALVAQIPSSHPEGELLNTPSPLPLREIDKWQTAPYCGVNSLYVLLRVLGQSADMTELRTAVPVTDRGASMLDLQDAARKHGLDLAVLSIKRPSDLARERRPFIALMTSSGFGPADGTAPSMGHYVVVLRIDTADDGTSTITAVDGTTAKLARLDGAKFNRAFSGYALMVPSSSRIVDRYLTPLLLFVLAVELGLLVQIGIRYVLRVRSSRVTAEASP